MTQKVSAREVMVSDSARRGVCIVTGAARGIGAATALAAGRKGYAVCINHMRAEAEADAIRIAIEEAGAPAMTCRADVSREEEVAALFAAADRALGPVTALVNNAGIAGMRRAFAEIDVEQFQRVIAVNLLGVFLCTKEAVRRMAKSHGGAGGSIVNLSSSAVRTGGMRIAPYVAAKAGIEGLTRALAVELAKDGIRVNAVSPGIIATDQQPLDDAAWRERSTRTIPIGRLGTPEEVGHAILWLLSDDASYVTGTVLDVTGGR
jgi:NAD(P)-dependent dehydrogenase (short-subunit alcohol dehydrogenase family)